VSSLAFEASGGDRSVSVATEDRCAWSATTLTPWLTIVSGVARTGNGTITVTAAANAAASGRTGDLAVAGQTVAVQQAGLAACSYEIDPGSASIDSDGGTGSIAVRALPHCPWTAASTEPWLQVTAGQTGAGDGTVNYTVGRNPDPTPRQASIQVADRTFGLMQQGDADACSYAVAPVMFTPCMSWSGELTSLVTTQDGCSWEATSGVPWITITRGASGTGSGIVGFSGSDNYDRPRTGVVMIRWPTPTEGQNVQVQQAGCIYGVSPGSFSFGAAGGSASFDLLQQSEPQSCGGALQDRCVWTAVSNAAWITVTTSMPRTGDSRVAFTAAPFTGTGTRTGTITVSDQVVQITQTGN
jgi:hypothetical protein